MSLLPMERFIRKVEPLVCGIFAHTDREEGGVNTRVGGSGIFVAPFQVLTARHICRDFANLVPEQADYLQKRTSGYTTLPYRAGLFQRHGALEQGSERFSTWAVRRAWDPGMTDLALIEVVADGGESVTSQYEMPTSFPEWSLLPPPVGSSVALAGFPSAKVQSNGTGLQFSGPFEAIYDATVTDVYDIRLARGYCDFPCFAIDQAVDGGFSGGPVFFDNKLCGLVAAVLNDRTIVSSLWPISRLKYEYPDLGSIGGTTEFKDNFERKIIVAPGWRGIVNRVVLNIPDQGEPFVELLPEIT